MATLSDELLNLSLTELNQQLRAKEIAVRDLVTTYCDRLEQQGPKYNALALSLRERALKQAKTIQDDIARQRFRGVLQGIPFGAKDLLSIAGTVTTWGAKPYAQQKLDVTATAIARLEKTGAICIGKLSMVELAGGPSYRYAKASLQGPGLNPWNTEYWSGGSSSGSGSAVAARLVPFALGSETSGSILTPSAYCGITGLRPTYGLVSRHGAMALSWTLDKIGPMGRSADDCGHVLQVIAGADEQDPGSAGKRFYYTPQYTPQLKTLRVGWAPSDFSDWTDPAATPLFQAAVEVFRGLGVQFSEKKLPDLPYGPVLTTILGAEAASIFEPLIRDGRVNELADERQIAGLKAALDLPARHYLKAMRVRRQMIEQLRTDLSGVDVLIAPSRFGTASRVTDPLDAPPSYQPRSQERGLTGIIGAMNLAGWPALSLPCGVAPNGLPVGIQIVGRPFSENTLLALGREFQRVTNHHRQRPKT